MSAWDKIKGMLATSAPVVGGLLGGPAGGAVGAMIAGAIGTTSDPEAILAKLESDPEAILKIKQLESDERKHLQDIQLQTLQAELQDVQNARQSHKDHWMPSVITMVLAVMVAVIGAALLMYPVPDTNKDMTVYLFGQITGTFTTAVAYWIGTSRSSHNKDKMLAQQ